MARCTKLAAVAASLAVAAESSGGLELYTAGLVHRFILGRLRRGQPLEATAFPTRWSARVATGPAAAAAAAAAQARPSGPVCPTACVACAASED